MPRIKKKKIIKWLVLILVLIFVVAVFYWQDVKKIFSPLSEDILKKNTENENKKEEISPSPTSEENQKIQETRNDFINYVSKNISSLSPQAPVLGSHWEVNRFWFIKDSIAYVEYEDGQILRQILVESKETEGKINYKVLGYFEPGNNEWILREGDDPYFGKTGDLYEWDDINKNWKKR